MFDIAILFILITYSLIGTICALEVWENKYTTSKRDLILVYLIWPYLLYKGIRTLYEVYQVMKARKKLEGQ